MNEKGYLTLFGGGRITHFPPTRFQDTERQATFDHVTVGPEPVSESFVKLNRLAALVSTQQQQDIGRNLAAWFSMMMVSSGGQNKHLLIRR